MRTLIALLIGFALLAPTAAFAATPAHYDRLFYYRDSDLAKKSLYAHAASIDIFAPQSYAIGADGTLSGTLDQKLVDFAHSKKIRIMPVATNGAFSIADYQALLEDPGKRGTTIAALVAEAKDRGYWGWQIDFEQMEVGDREAFTSFITQAAETLHAAGLKLSVAVIAKVSDNPGDYKKTLWQDLIGAYDYDALAAQADFISVMSYDDPESTGPVVEYSWLLRVLEYARLHIPANKISLGIPLYYWKWNDLTGKLVEIGGNEGIDNVFKKYPVSVYYDPTYHAPSLFYRINGVPYTIWYENARSVAEKIALVKKYKLGGVSLWALGLELPSIYGSIKE